MNSPCIKEFVTSALRVRQELARRAGHFTAQRFLSVNYYRIRKRLAVPLPVSGPPPQGHYVRAFSSPYPWLIWFFWALEDRIVALGEFVNQTSDIAARSAVEADLSALAAWETYRESAYSDLSYAHAVRILSIAITRWDWIEATKRSVLRDALRRAVEDALPPSDQINGWFNSKSVPLATSGPHEHLHNINLIGACALAWAAGIVEHRRSSELNARVGWVLTSMLDLRQLGFTEGVSYDGYVLDFLSDWLTVLDPDLRDKTREQQSLVPTLFSSEAAALWWVFSFAAERPTFRLVDQAFEIDGRRVPIDARQSLPCSLYSVLRHETLIVTAMREKNMVKATAHLNPDVFYDEPEYAFYLMADGHKVLMRWYTPKPEVSFAVPESVRQHSLEIRGFMRERTALKKRTVITTVSVIEK